MKLLLDINLVLDVILKRQPWVTEAARLLAEIERGKASGYVAGHTITTVYYVTAKSRGRQAAAAAVSDLLRLVEVIPVEKTDFHQALTLGWSDFEDAVQAACALKIAADAIVTRNERDFRNAAIPAKSPGVILAGL